MIVDFELEEDGWYWYFKGFFEGPFDTKGLAKADVINFLRECGLDLGEVNDEKRR